MVASNAEDTLTVICAEFEQLFPSVPVTDHVVFEDGVALNELPLPEGFHV
jgi:hypothetical protein